MTPLFTIYACGLVVGKGGKTKTIWLKVETQVVGVQVSYLLGPGWYLIDIEDYLLISVG